MSFHSPALKKALCLAPLLLLGGEALLHMLQVMAGRIGYRYELEWMEGAMLQQVLRVLHGQPLYGEPTLAFVPALYMPLYYYVSALSVLVFGENLFALRLVSVAAALLTHLLVFMIVRRVSGSRLAGLLGLLLFSSTYPYTAFWFDVARVDSLWTCLLAFSTYQLLKVRGHPDRRQLAVLLLAWIAALMAKQSTLFVLPFFCLALWCWCGFAVAFRTGIAFLLGSTMLVGLLQLAYGDLFFFYTFQMASTHGITAFGFRRFATDIVFSVAGLLIIAAVFPCLNRQGWRNGLGWFCVLTGFFVTSMVSRAYAGAFFNVLMPLHFVTATLGALTLYGLVELAVNRKGWIVLPALAAILLVSTEMYAHRYQPQSRWPTSASLAAHESLVERLVKVHGPVCVTAHGYLGWLAGQDFCAHNTQVTDVTTGSDPALAAALQADARRRILAGEYAVIVLDREKELNDFGLQLAEIPYTVSAIEYPEGPLQFPVNGRAPALWLQYNGTTQHE